MKKKGDIIWLMNKFPVFEHTWPTVIVETSDHNGELSTYEPEKLHEVVSFGLSHWLKLESDKRFKSVLYFRNYGPGSGGSQRHPHSQIIGLENYDYRDNILGENFLGSLVHEDEDCYATISDYPLSCMGELNVTLKKTLRRTGLPTPFRPWPASCFTISPCPAPATIYSFIIT